MELWNQIREIFNLSILKTENINLTAGAILALIAAFVLTSIILRLIRKFTTRRLNPDDKNKFVSIFQFIQYVVYVIVIIFALKASGFDVTVLLTASAALFIGLGFALQQLFQDLIAGILIILDQSLTVGDIIEVNDKVCRVEKISLRSTKAVTRNQRVMIIPNHIFMNDILFNWTQKGPVIRENVSVGVAYGSDTALVEKLLLQAVQENEHVLPENPHVFFEDFADSSLNFSVYFYVSDGFRVLRTKSEIRFKIDKLFREHNINIPFPQREVTIKKDGFVE